MQAAEREWVGGRFFFPGYVLENGPFRPTVLLWMELPEGLIISTRIIDPHDPLTFAESLAAAAAHPTVGMPRRPGRVRVSDPALARELRGAHPDVEVVTAPTPELDAAMVSMAAACAGGEPRSYLDEGVPADAVAALFASAQLL